MPRLHKNHNSIPTTLTSKVKFPSILIRKELHRVRVATSEEGTESILQANEYTKFWNNDTKSEDDIIHFIHKYVLNDDNDEHKTPSEYDKNRIEIKSIDPLLLIIHNFLEEDLCDKIINTTIQKGNLQRSTLNSDQSTDDLRTSETTWLQEQDCEIPLRTLAHRVSKLSNQPPTNMENLQVVRYLPGQKFDVHTDHLNEFNDLDCRGRLATCLIYLNGDFSGGETSFPHFNVAVTPRKGSAVFFWNTVEKPGHGDYDPYMFLNVDERMRHAGLPVLDGVKWVCNRWIHPIPFGRDVRGW